MRQRYQKWLMRLIQFLSPPDIAPHDQEEARLTALYNTIALWVMLAFSLYILIGWTWGKLNLEAVGLVSLIFLVTFSFWLGLRRRYMKLLSRVSLVLIWTLATLSISRFGGIRDASYMTYVPIILASGLLFGRRASLWVMILSISVGAWFAYAENMGLYPMQSDPPFQLWFDYVLVIVLTFLVFMLTLHSMQTTLNRARANQEELADLNHHLQDEIVQRHQTEVTLRSAEALLLRRSQELSLINQTAQDLNAALETGEVNERLLQAVVETIGAEGASIWLYENGKAGKADKDDKNGDSPGLICRAVFRPDRDRILINLHLDPGQGLAGWVAQHGHSVIVDDVTQDPRFYPGVDAISGFRTRSLLTVPLSTQGQILGILQVANKIKDNFNNDDLIFAETLAMSAAIALENAQLVESLRLRTQDLKKRNEDLDAYAHTVAHDLKTPLTRMVGFSELLAESHKTMPDQEREQYLQIVARNGRNMITIVDELLLLAGVREAKTIKRSSLNMNPIIQRVQDRLAGPIEAAQAEIISPPIWPKALGYAPWIEEVWANYLSNAIKYGGQPPKIKLGAETLPAGQIRFWVQDNGQGLKPEDLSSLFVPFARLGQPQTRGHGLGLSIVRRIIEKLDGQVGVESQGVSGQGSTFWFTLPAAESV